ncbi:unnamed protein product, partial [Iphiclides podalirius]
MTDFVEGGAVLAWRLLATLEGGSLLLATSALLAYTARSKVARRQRRPVRNVLITNTTNTLGRELSRRLISRGCTVSTVTSEAASEAGADRVDALVVVGANVKQDGLHGLSEMVTEDMYDNVKLLESLSPLVRAGGCVAWACAGKLDGAFKNAGTAYDAVIKASLQHIAKSRHCEPVWIGRFDDASLVAERLVASLMPCANQQDVGFSIRNAAQKLSNYLGRWLKIIT